MDFEGNTGREQRIRKLLSRRNPESRVVEVGALIFLGPEKLVFQRIVDNPGNDLVIPGEADRYAEMR
jgi:hypothetical protein